MTFETRLWILAIAFFAAFVILGIFVSTHSPSRLDIEGGYLRGMSTGLAAMLTFSGRALPLLGLAILTVLLFLVLKKPIWVPLAILASQVASQGVVELFKRIFLRNRPDAWLVNHELGYSYPSGHATTAIVFFGTWLLIVMLFPVARPLKVLLALVLIVWMIGIDWSRMALSAHYLSDVIGGTFFGCAWMCVLLALLTRLRIPIMG
jgi:membrane-associated phospholipid phosphatase